MVQEALYIYSYKEKMSSLLPFYSSYIQAGFPSPADDFVDVKLDLNDYMVKNPVSTFFVRVVGDSMRNLSIFSGDMLVVDRSLEPGEDSIIVAIIDGEFIVKQLRKCKEEMKPGTQFQVWGVVTYVVHKTK